MIHSKNTMKWIDLKKLGRAIPVPFLLPLADSQFPIECEEIVRIIPGKRLVVFGVWRSQPIVAKIFIQPRKAIEHLNQDVTGVEALVNAGVPTPKILYKGAGEDKHIQVVIFNRLIESKNLDALWRNKRCIEERATLMRHVTIELATQHVMGIVQRDLHLKNFLITKKKIYTLDGGSIEQVDGILSRERSIDHLALFFSQLGMGTEELQAQLFGFYTKARGWIVKDADHILLQKLIEKWNKSRWEQFEKKIFRNCTAFGKIKKANTFVMYDRDYATPEFMHLLKHPEAAMTDLATEILKNGNSSTVAKIQMNGKPLVIKRYNVKNAAHGLRRCLRATRAADSWRLSHELELFGIATAKPVAFIENRFLGLRGSSYLIMEYVDGMHLGDFLLQDKIDDSIKEKVAQKVMAIFMYLAKLRLTHGDLKMTNILIANEQPVIIDLDGMDEHRTYYGLKRAMQKDRLRFMKNWESFPKIRALFERI